MKRLFYLLAAGLLLFGSLSSAGKASAIEYSHIKIGDLYYTLIENGKNSRALVVEEVNGIDNYASLSGKVVIPEKVEYKGKTFPVTEIYGSGFKNASKITDIVIPSSVRAIGASVFVGTGLYNNASNWEDGILYISDCLIASKEDISGVGKIKDGTRLIAQYAFKQSKITSLTIPNTVEYIDRCAFYQSSLTEVTLPNSNNYKQVSPYTFTGCNSLQRVICPANIEQIFTFAFENCSALTELYLYYPGVVSTYANSFTGTDISKLTVYVPKSLVTTYQTTSYWKGINIEPLPSKIQIDGIWYDCDEEHKTAKVIAEKEKNVDNYAALTGKVTIPESITVGDEEYAVTEMELAALAYAPVTEVDIQAHLTYIPEYAFYKATNMTDLTLPQSVERIGTEAFSDCAKLQYINGLTNWGGEELPNLTTIGDRAFYNCKSLKYLNLSHVKTIEYGAFLYCSYLEQIVLGSATTSIGESAFYMCDMVSDIMDYAVKPQPYQSGMLPYHTTIIYVPRGSGNAYKTAEGWKYHTIKEMDYVIDDIHYTIDDATGTAAVTFDKNDFSNYSSLSGKIIEIPAELDFNGKKFAVIAIEDNAFRYAPIKKVVLPESLKSIGEKAFNFSSVEAVDWSEIENPCSLGAYAFDHCTKLKEVTLPATVAKINEAAFGDCHALETVVLQNGVQEIGEYAFSNCILLDNLQMSSVVSIGAYAFQHCEELGRLTLPETVTSIGDYAFNGCTDLYEIYNLNSTPQTINANVFNGLKLGDIDLYVPPTRKDAYEAKAVWQDFNVKEAKAIVDGLYYRINPSSHTAQLTFDDIIYTYKSLSGKVTVPATIEYNAETYNVTSIGNYAFRENSTITEVELPEGIISIGSESFNTMSALTKINIPSTVETIGRFNNNGITANDANFSNGLLIIDNCILRAKKDHTGEVTIPDGTRIIADEAFYNCKEITKVSVPQTVKEIGQYAFQNCIKLEEITLPEGLRVLRRGVFEDCSSLGGASKPIILPESLVEIERDAFGWGGKGCTSLEEIYIPSNVRKIGSLAFWNATNLRVVHLPANIEFLGDAVFSDASKLENIWCEAPNPTAISLGVNVFSGVPSGVKLHVPYGSKVLFEAADQWKDLIIEEMYPCIDGFYYILDDEKHTATLTYELKRSEWSSSINYKKLNKKLWTIPAKVALNSEVYDVVALGESAFKNTDVKKIILPEGLTSIGEDAISESPNLEEVCLPSTLTEIGDFAFYYSTAIKKIYNNATTPQDIKGKGVFGNAELDKSKVKLYVPNGCVAAYKAADEWKDFDIQEQPVCVDGLYYILDEVNGTATVTWQYDDEDNYSKLESVVIIPATITVQGKDYKVTAIGDNAFKYSDVCTFYIQADIQSIGHNAFAYLKYGYDFWLYTLKTPLSIGEDVFENSGRMYMYLRVPFGCVEAYEEAAVWKDFPTILEMPVLIDGIYYSLYEYESELSAVVDYDYSFRNYEHLGEEIVIPDVVSYDSKEYKVEGVNEMKRGMINKVVKKITISNGIVYLGDWCYYACTALEEVVLPASIEIFGGGCFMGCTALKQITNPNPIPVEIDEYVFKGVDISKVTLLVPANSVEAYKATEVWKEFKIEPIETPIVIAGQKITPDKYNTMISGEGITGDVFVTENGIFLDEKAEIYCKDIPAIELTGTDKVDKFIISGVHGTICGIVISGKAEVQINGALPDGIEHDGALSLELYGYNGQEGHAIELTEGAQVTLNLNGIASESKDSLTFWGTSEAIHTPFGASCDIHAGGNVDFFIQEDNCPVGYNDRTFTLHNTTMILPFGGSVTEDGVLDAAGEEMFALRLSTNAPFKQSGKAYPIELFGVTVTEGNAADILGDGKASYNAETNTLMLDGVDVDHDNPNSEYQALRVVKSSINVEVKGKNNLYVISERPVIEVESGDLRIFGDKDAELRLYEVAIGIRGDQTEQYRVAVEGCTLFILTEGSGNALQADSLYIDAANVTLVSKYGVAWQSWNANKNGGLVLKHALLKEGLVNVSSEMLFEPVPQYKVTFQDKDGNLIEEQYVFEGEGAVAPDAPEVEGMTFLGWSLPISEIMKDITVQAEYEHIVCHVEFHDWDGKVVYQQDLFWGSKADRPIDPYREGYTFTGWDKDFSAVKEDMVITAQYAINTFTVRFYDHNDQVISTQTVNWNEAAIEPELTPWEGHTFTSWSADFEHVQSDLDIKPIYDVQVYKVTFLGFNDTELKVENVEYGKNATAPSAPDVEGYTFTGWDKDFDNITGDLTVKAVYEKNPDLTPQNLSAELTEKDGDTEITLSWDKVAGVPSYEVKLTVGEKELGAKNTFGKNTVTELLSAVVKEYNIKPGTYLVSWAVRSTDIMGTAVSDWAEGIAFQITVKDTGTGVTDVTSDDVPCTKVLRNGVLYLMYKGAMYDVQGRKVE